MNKFTFGGETFADTTAGHRVAVLVVGRVQGGGQGLGRTALVPALGRAWARTEPVAVADHTGGLVAVWLGIAVVGLQREPMPLHTLVVPHRREGLGLRGSQRPPLGQGTPRASTPGLEGQGRW